MIICHQCGCDHESLRWCHCATCHETFGGLGGFDQHRVGGRCVPPGGLKGLSAKPIQGLLPSGVVWVKPAPPMAKTAAAKANSTISAGATP